MKYFSQWYAVFRDMGMVFRDSLNICTYYSNKNKKMFLLDIGYCTQWYYILYFYIIPKFFVFVSCYFHQLCYNFAYFIFLKMVCNQENVVPLNKKGIQSHLNVLDIAKFVLQKYLWRIMFGNIIGIWPHHIFHTIHMGFKLVSQ